ncbi:hypothetical protein QQZ08_008305 [Neonectria magnoliae]|uniref:non-specific serine/threonine protein kinase n=1 Tax=Neonectria magnoliae TaxID=2732573 RepID=A0ABR1HW26_9HYPO
MTATDASPRGTEEAITSAPLAHGTTDDWGDFVDSDDECEIEEVAESPDRYVQGLYYPTYIGEVLADKYRVEHKLGHGGFSTVWMAYDLLGKRDVALKIMKPGDSGEHEYHIQNEIIRTVQDTSHLLTYWETFLLRGSHGNHRVLVFPLQGPNLRDCTRQKPVATRMSAARQLLQALKGLHDSGIVHRGKLT